MRSVRLKGVNRVSKRLASGERVTYWYAWKGGARLEGEPGSPEFAASYAAAHKARKQPQSQHTLATLVARYRASPEFERNAESTKAEWRRWLDRIEAADIASLPWAALEEPDSRPVLIDWRDTYADRPRTADYGAQVLARVLTWAGPKGRGLLRAHHFEDVPRLDDTERADQVWTDDELTRFCKAAAPHVGRALRLACLTGLRRGDLVALTWEQIGERAIVRPTNKGRRKGAVATIPLLAETRELLGPRGKGVVLRNSRGDAWTPDGLENRIWTVKTALGIDKRLHDARGTFATRLRLAGLTRDEIASVMGWESQRVERLLARYVDNERVILSIADKLAQNGR